MHTSNPPLIDIAPLLTDTADAAEITACAEEIHRACLDWGFFVAVGHGLERPMAGVFDAATRFFSLPQADKEATPRVDRYGFVPLRTLAIDTDRASDNTEFLDMGLRDEVALPAVPGFEDAVRSYQAEALRVGEALLRAIASQLGAGPDFFADRMRNPQCRLRFLHYPPVEPDERGVLPVSTTAHTDYGALTLLATDGVPGLEVRPRSREWTPVVAPAGALVVNLGDMLRRWTNDRYQSTPHRVVGPAAGDRISIPFFVNPDPATVVTAMASCITDEHPEVYGPITAGEFLAQRIDGRDEPYVDPTEGPERRIGAGAT